MINKREILTIVLAAMIIGYVESFSRFSWMEWLSMSALGLAVVAVHSLGQKIGAMMFDATTETSIWKVESFWFTKKRHFSKPFPAGLFFPLILLFATFGYLKFLAVTTFEVSAFPSKMRAFAKVTELQIAVIALSGSIANALVSLASFILGFREFAMLNLFFIFFNLLPISALDGAKIFFGSRLLWVFSFCFISSLIILFELAGFWAALISALIIAFVAWIAYYMSFER